MITDRPTISKSSALVRSRNGSRPRRQADAVVAFDSRALEARATGCAFSRCSGPSTLVLSGLGADAEGPRCTAAGAASADCVTSEGVVRLRAAGGGQLPKKVSVLVRPYHSSGYCGSEQSPPPLLLEAPTPLLLKSFSN
jgi:hypothetical protein